MIDRHSSFSDHLTAFANFLRQRSFVVGIEEVHNSLRALTQIDIGDSRQFLSLLKTNFCCTPFQWRSLEDHYQAFVKEYKRAIDSKIKEIPQDKPKASAPKNQPRKYQLDNVKNWLFRNSPEILNTPFYSNQSSQEYSDLSDLAFDKNPSLQEQVRLLAKCLVRQKRTRKKNHLSKGEINLRELLRNKFIYGDELLKLIFQYNPKFKTKLILLCDVSRSMDLYSHFLSHFIFYLQDSFDFQSTYVFNTQLHRLGIHGGQSWQEMKGDFAHVAGLWGEGTKIGACLQSFLEERPTWFDRHTKVVVFSDGWDMGELDLLDDSLARLKRIGGQLIWLNPVLKNPDAEKVAGIQIIRSYVDLLAPLYNLETMQELVEEMSR